MSNLIDKYSPRDFQAYFAGAYFVHPTEKTICRVHSVNSEGVARIVTAEGKALPHVAYKEFSFATFKDFPALGYRHIEGGKFLYRICKRAVRQAAKGLREETVVISLVPEVTRLCMMCNSRDKYEQVAALNGALLESIFRPSFLSLEEAIEALGEKGEALGVALSSSLAVTLLPTNNKTPFVILFKQQRAALSADGVTWKPTHDEYASLLKRSIPSIKLETTV